MSHTARLLLEVAKWARLAHCRYSRRIWAEQAAELAGELIAPGCEVRA